MTEAAPTSWFHRRILARLPGRLALLRRRAGRNSENGGGVPKSVTADALMSEARHQDSVDSVLSVNEVTIAIDEASVTNDNSNSLNESGEPWSMKRVSSMPVDKDNLFWNAIVDLKIPKKKLKKKVGQAKLTNASELALRYDVAKKDVENVYNIFISMDDDGSGKISASEVAKMLCDYGVDVSPKVVQAVMRSSDKSGDGEIDFEEFLVAVTSKIKNPDEQSSSSEQKSEISLNNCKADIHVMFERFDTNGDGLLSAEELVVAWRETLKTNLTVQEANALIQQADTEGRGAVTVNEFITMCQTV